MLKKRGRPPKSKSIESRQFPYPAYITIGSEKEAIKMLKEVWKKSAHWLFGQKVDPAKTKEALAVALQCARTYVELTEDGLSYIAKSKAPNEDVVLLADLRSRIGDVDGSKGIRQKYYIAAQNVIHMWQALPNDNYFHKTACVDIEIMKQDIRGVDEMLREAYHAFTDDDMADLPKGYAAISDQRNRMIANVSKLYEVVGLTAKLLKDVKGADTSHALDRLQTNTSKIAKDLESSGLDDLMANIGEEKVISPIWSKEQQENIPEDAIMIGKDLTPIDEAYINEPFVDSDYEPSKERGREDYQRV